MKFSTDTCVLVVYALTLTDAFAPSAFRKAQRINSKAQTHHPTRNNVSSRKIKPWYHLHLEPWAGLQLNSAVDESTDMHSTDYERKNRKLKHRVIFDVATIFA